MKIKLLVLVTSVFFGFTAIAQISPLRTASESWQEAAARQMSSVATPLYNAGNAYSVSDSIFTLNPDDIEYESDLIEIESAFYLVRDYRFLKNRKDDNFLRRITWLFPDDGCYARAALMKDQLAQLGVPTSRIFIFGDLKVDTDNHPSGSVSWWYHTAPVMKTADGTVFVLDPSIEAQRPLTLEEWTLRQVPALDQALLSICSGDTYGPNISCTSTVDPIKMANSDILYLLDFEWNRQKMLKRVPEEVLGDMPPWFEVDEEEETTTDLPVAL